MGYKFICRRHAAERFMERFGEKYGCKTLGDANKRIYTFLLNSEMIGESEGIHKFKSMTHIMKRATQFGDVCESKHYRYFKCRDVYFVTAEDNRGTCEVLTCLSDKELEGHAERSMVRACDCLRRRNQNADTT